MQIISLILFIAYNLVCLLYFKRHFPEKRGHWVYYVIAIAINIAFGYTADHLDLYRIRLLAITTSFMLELKLLFKMDLLRILHGGGAYALVVYSSRGITVSVFSIILRKSVYDLLRQDFYYYIITSIALLIALGYILCDILGLPDTGKLG